MKDYSESMINARQSLDKTHDCLLNNNPMDAYHYAMQVFREIQEIMEYCLEKSREF